MVRDSKQLCLYGSKVKLLIQLVLWAGSQNHINEAMLKTSQLKWRCICSFTHQIVWIMLKTAQVRNKVILYWQYFREKVRCTCSCRTQTRIFVVINFFCRNSKTPAPLYSVSFSGQFCRHKYNTNTNTHTSDWFPNLALKKPCSAYFTFYVFYVFPALSDAQKCSIVLHYNLYVPHLKDVKIYHQQ